MSVETFKILVNLKLVILIVFFTINELICKTRWFAIMHFGRQQLPPSFHTFIMNNLLIHSIGLKLNYFLVHAPNIIHLSILVQPFFFSRLLLMFLPTVHSLAKTMKLASKFFYSHLLSILWFSFSHCKEIVFWSYDACSRRFILYYTVFK